MAIARALAAEPDVLICDEITSALDVSVQGSIVALLEGLRQQRGISMLFVTHNLALVRSIAARVEILQAGRVVEAGSVVTVMETPAGGVHPQPPLQEPEDRLTPVPTSTAGSRLAGLVFTDPQHDPAWRHVVVRRPPAGRRCRRRPATSRCDVAGAGRSRGLEEWVRRDVVDAPCSCSTGARSSTSGTPTGWAPTRCSSAPR